MSEPTDGTVLDRDLDNHVEAIEKIVADFLGVDTLEGLQDQDVASPETLQRLLSAAVKLYVAARVGQPDLQAFPPGTMTATEVAVTSRAMLEAVNMEIFELGLWNSWGM